MALRATRDPAPSTRSARVGEVVTFTAKVENTSNEAQEVSLHVEDLHEGALHKPVAFTFAFEPARLHVPARSRRAVSFTWRAGLPEGKAAHTFRGHLALKQVVTGETVGHSPLDLYVSS